MCQPKKKPRRLVEDLDHRRGNQQAVTVSKELYGALYIDRNGHINVYDPVCNFNLLEKLCFLLKDRIQETLGAMEKI